MVNKRKDTTSAKRPTNFLIVMRQQKRVCPPAPHCPSDSVVQSNRPMIHFQVVKQRPLPDKRYFVHTFTCWPVAPSRLQNISTIFSSPTYIFQVFLTPSITCLLPSSQYTPHTSSPPPRDLPAVPPFPSCGNACSREDLKLGCNFFLSRLCAEHKTSP